ncbi:MAG TPA: ATP-binding protein [Planctomycetaceae bacterium]|nr:ATP-binding protein [Planctomycetaceae bacterium]
MLSSQLFWRVLLVSCGLTVGIAVAFFLLLSQRYEEIALQQVEQRLREDVDTILAVLSSTPESSAAELPVDLLDTLQRRRASHIVIFDRDGTLLWPDEQKQLDNDLPVFLTKAGRADEYRWEIDHFTSPDGQQWMIYRKSAPPSASPAHEIRAAFPTTHLQRALWRATLRIWVIVAVFALCAIVIAYVFVGRIVEPLDTLTKAAEAIAAGQFPGDVPIHSRNEIGTLAQSFNSMSRQLTSRIQDLQEQRLQAAESHHRLEAVLSAMVEGVMAIDGDQQILLANQAAVRLLDLRPQNIVGRPFWEAVRQTELHQLVNDVLAGNLCDKTEIEVARTQSVLAVTATRFNGEPCSGAVLVMHDITELRRLENLRREFVQNVSHELKTPLSSIAAYADTLLEGGLEDADSNRHFVQRIVEQSDRLHTLILDLIALARMETNEHTYEVIPTDVTRIVQTSIDAHQAVAGTKQIQLRGEGTGESLIGMADDDGLRTIIDNLLDNALNHTPAGGRVTVRCSQQQGLITIAVEDTGVGIAKEYQTRIFERFFRIDRARSREMGGTGLGLAIVKHLCQMFGGSVKVQSQLGQGSTFIVQLPVAEENLPISVRSASDGIS